MLLAALCLPLRLAQELSIPNLVAFQATGSGTLSFSGTATLKEVVLGTERLDNGSNYNATTGKFIALSLEFIVSLPKRNNNCGGNRCRSLS